MARLKRLPLALFCFGSAFLWAQRPSLVTRRVVGLSRFTSGEALLEKLDKEKSLRPLEELGLEARCIKGESKSIIILFLHINMINIAIYSS